MLRVTVGNNTDRKHVLVPANVTLKSVLISEEIRFDTAVVTIDGASLKPGDLEKTFEEFGIKESCSLIAVVKADSAA